jgi:hypothetical protein
VLRRLEDRIRELCAHAIIARGHELENTLEKLKSALAEHTDRIRQTAIQKLLNPGKHHPPDRRLS